MTIEALSFRAFDATLMTQYSITASEALGSDFWVVTKPFTYYLGDKYSNRQVHVPMGYLTDGASVPRFFWNIIPPWGRWGQAAVVHDILCETLTIQVDGKPEVISRKECDKTLLEAMTVLEVPSTKRQMIYGAVSVYRILANVRKPNYDRDKAYLEEALRRRYEAHGQFS
jgi:hypothetical protein